MSYPDWHRWVETGKDRKEHLSTETRVNTVPIGISKGVCTCTCVYINISYIHVSLFLRVHLCSFSVCGRSLTTAQMCEHQKKTVRGWSSPSATWEGPGIKLKLLRLGGNCLYLVSHLASSLLWMLRNGEWSNLSKVRKMKLRGLCPWQVTKVGGGCELKGVQEPGSGYVVTKCLLSILLSILTFPQTFHRPQCPNITVRESKTQSGQAHHTEQHSPLKTSDTHNLKGLSMERWGGLKESGKKRQRARFSFSDGLRILLHRGAHAELRAVLHSCTLKPEQDFSTTSTVPITLSSCKKRVYFVHTNN